MFAGAGTKPYLLAASHEGAHRAARLYRLVTTTKLHRIEPFAWLRNGLDCIADHSHKNLDNLLPQNGSPKSS